MTYNDVYHQVIDGASPLVVNGFIEYLLNPKEQTRAVEQKKSEKKD